MRLSTATCRTILAGIAAGFLAIPHAADADVIKAVFDCEDGLKLDVAFDNDAEPNVAVVTIEGKAPLTLPIAVSGSGYYYTNGQYGLRGKGTEAMWEVGKMAPVMCNQAD